MAPSEHTSGEGSCGCFDIKVYARSSTKLGKAVQLRFIISQHVRDKALLEIIMKNLEPKCGTMHKNFGRNNKEFTVTSFKAPSEHT